MPKNKLDGNTRAREPITRSRGIVRGQFPSFKMNRMVAWESQLERRACYLFEFSRGIKSFREQPITFKVPFSDRVKRYTPDFELILGTGDIVYVEIKPENKLKDLDVLSFYNNISIQLIRERNLMILRGYQQQLLSNYEVEQTINWLKQRENPIYLKELMTFLGSIHKAYIFIAQGMISTDLDKPFSEDTIIDYLKEDDHESYLFACRTAPDFRSRLEEVKDRISFKQTTQVLGITKKQLNQLIVEKYFSKTISPKKD